MPPGNIGDGRYLTERTFPVIIVIGHVFYFKNYKDYNS